MASNRGPRKARGKIRSDQEYTSVKMPLKNILCAAHWEEFSTLMFTRCVAATKFYVLASLLFLFKVNTAIDENDINFFNRNPEDGEALITECFYSVNKDNIRRLPRRFRSMGTSKGIGWPKRSGMTNAFNYLIETYVTNVKNNLKTWSFKRMKGFLDMKRYLLNRQGHAVTDVDVKNTLRALFMGLDGTNGDQIREYNMDLLLGEVIDAGGPVGDMNEFVRNDWFRSLFMWLNIQRQIEDFHENLALFDRHNRHQRNSSAPKPPKVRNFTVIPLSGFQLKHIRIDNSELLQISKKLHAFKEVDGSNRNQIDWWSSLFNFHKINQICRSPDSGREFKFSFVTDSVSISLLFAKPNREEDVSAEAQEKKKHEIWQKWFSDQMVYELGIDPGMRTWNATVRRNYRTGKEVFIQNEMLPLFSLCCE